MSFKKYMGGVENPSRRYVAPEVTCLQTELSNAFLYASGSNEDPEDDGDWDEAEWI